MPDSQLFVRAFGSLTRAYDAAGVPRTKRHNFVAAKERLVTVHDRLFVEVCRLAALAGARIETIIEKRMLVVDGATIVRVVAVQGTTPLRGRRYWRVQYTAGVDYTVVARYNSPDSSAFDYCLVSAEEFDGRQMYIKEENSDRFSGLRRKKLAELFGQF